MVSAPVLTFFNNKGGVGKTSLVYHLSHMLAKQESNVLAVDLDPQANLTAAFLEEDDLAGLWDAPAENEGATIYQCVQPLAQVGDIREPKLRHVGRNLTVLPGDLALSGFEELISSEWPNCLVSSNLYRAFRVVSAFWQAAQMGASTAHADIVLVDVGPNLGAINRSALIASDYIVVPLGADLYSLQGLRNLGPTLRKWREEWNKRLDNWNPPEFSLPRGSMQPLGYVVQQHGVRLSRSVKAYDKWVNRIPGVYRKSVLQDSAPISGLRPSDDPHCLATLKHYRSLVPMGQEARKPIFSLSVADGAIGSHAIAVQNARQDFDRLAKILTERMEVVH